MACLQVFLLWEEPIAAVCQATREEPMEQVTSSVPASFHTHQLDKPKPQPEWTGCFSQHGLQHRDSADTFILRSRRVVHLCRRTSRGKQGLNSTLLALSFHTEAPAEIRLTRLRAEGQRRLKLPCCKSLTHSFPFFAVPTKPAPRCHQVP